MANCFRVKYCNCKALLFITIVSLVLSIIYYNQALKRSIKPSKKPYKLLTAGCTIDELNLNDVSLKKLFRSHRKFSCPQRPENLLIYQTEDGYLRVDPKTKKKLKVLKRNKHKKFMCTKKAVYRHQWEKNTINAYRLSPNVTEFTKWTLMDIEFAEVICKAGDTQVYRDYFFNVIRKPEVESACETNREIFLKNNPNCAREPHLSVLLLGIDSLSKSNFLREMPLTLDVLTTQFSAIDMSGYNKAGINTFPSLIPYLSGYSKAELAKGCWGGKNNLTFDNCTFIWDLFANAGYRTAFVENMDQFALFNSDIGGTHRQLAHYFGHTLYPLALKNSIKLWCWRGEPDDYRVVQWARMFQKEFAKDLHFGHFWMSIFTHGDINGAERLDKLVSDTFLQMIDEKILNNTLLIFMSDHGLRFGGYRQTETGRKDDNLPFMYLVFPPWFRERYPAAIQQVMYNGERLITTFDLHETLKSIISCEYTNSSIEKPAKKRGISFFKPISEFRTCVDAGIPITFCGCKQNVVEMSKNSTNSKRLAELVVDQINNYTAHLRNICAEFRLKKILNVKKLNDITTNNDLENTTTTAKSVIVHPYIVSVSVSPGEAKFEATVQSVSQNSWYVVYSDVKRIDQYGNSSYCVSNDSFLKTVCFCTKFGNKR